MPYKDPQKRKEYHNAYMKQWNKDNLDKVNAWARKRYARNPEKFMNSNREYRQANKDKVNLAAKKRRIKNPEVFRNKTLKNRYKISSEQYDSLLKRNGPLCAICKEEPKRLNLDHCHVSGRIREFLCQHCNSGLGFFRDRPELLKAAIEYLTKEVNS